MTLDDNFSSFSKKGSSKYTLKANVIMLFVHRILTFYISCNDLGWKHKLPLKQTLFLQIRRNLGISVLQLKSELTAWYIENNVSKEAAAVWLFVCLFLNGVSFSLSKLWRHLILKPTRLRTFHPATEFLSLRSKKEARATSEKWNMVVMPYLSRWHFRNLQASICGQQACSVAAPTEYWWLRTELEMFQLFHTERLHLLIYTYIHRITGGISLLVRQICYGMLTQTSRI